MRLGLYLPLDELNDGDCNPDLAADFLELSAFFAADSLARTSDIANEAAIGAEEQAVELHDELTGGMADAVSVVVQRIESREEALGSAYPFCLDEHGDILSFELCDDGIGPSAYVLSLVLSNLYTPILNGSPLLPCDMETRELRRWFQYMSTAALAAEIQGVAWSFGSPRPDGSSFLGKLAEIWREFEDGRVGRQPGAPVRPQDDQIDVFAARIHRDRLPGFVFAVAQVATGKQWAEKSLLGHLDAFRRRWFADAPVTRFIPYMIIPFALDDLKFRDHVSFLGNLLHRLRLPRRVSEAESLVRAGIEIEAYDMLPRVVDWVREYRGRARDDGSADDSRRRTPPSRRLG